MRLLAAALVGASLAGCHGDPAPDMEHPPRGEALVRPDTPGNSLLFNFDPGDTVESFASPGGRFRVHFTRDGNHAVPDADDDTSGVPDFVEEVAAVYDEVVGFYEGTLGFRPPLDDADIGDNGGDARFDVYLVDFAGSGDGNYQNDACHPDNPEICAGFMVQENDFAGYGYPSTLVANRVVGSHELFHGVQAAYDIGQGSILAEGTAVWATEQFDPSLSDFEAFIPGYFQNPDRSLDVPLPGPVDPFSYGSAIFFQFLEERFGPGTVRDLWERCVNESGSDPGWFGELDALIAGREAGGSFAFAFEEFAIWNLLTGMHADPTRSYAQGASYPELKMNDVALPFSDDRLRVFYASAQYYWTLAGDRDEVTAALIDVDGAGTEGAVILLAPRGASGYGDILRVSDVSAGTETIDTSDAGYAVAVVVNPASSGDSLRPAFCFGSPDEVAACREAHGAGGGGEGGAGGALPVDDEVSEDEGCSCRAAGSGGPRGAGAVAAYLAVCLGLCRRKRMASAR